MSNPWQRTRARSGWAHNGLVEWTERDTAFLSVVFSWRLPDAYQKAVWWGTQGYRVRAGGPAVLYNPSYLADVAEVGGEADALPHHNPNATFTSRGCIRRCKFCIVPKIEGGLVELDDWPVRPIVCDNNLLACSREHFDSVMEKLEPLSGIDFNQGLDARLLTEYHAERLAELDTVCIRLAFDDTRSEGAFLKAFNLLRGVHIPASHIRAYVLIGHTDTPEDALYRLNLVYSLGSLPQPMRYQPIDTPVKNSYVAPNWTDAELKRYMRYWHNLWVTANIPFEDFMKNPRQRINHVDQMSFPSI